MYDQVKVLGFHKKLAEWEFTFPLNVVMEYEFVPEGETAEETRKSTLAFTKRLNALMPAVSAVYEKQCQVYYAFREFPCVYKLMFTTEAFNYLSKLYANLDYQLQELNKVLKQQKNSPEFAEYFDKSTELLNVNVWEMMVEDFNAFEPVSVERMNESKAKDPEFNRWSEPTVDWNKVKDLYKSELKSLKEKK